MKSIFGVLFCTVVFLTGQISYGQPIEAVKVWETPDLLTTSESVLFHETENVLFVSCINGKPLEKNGQGFISKVSLNGEILILQWAKGLHAPKGMGVYDGSLYVTDIDRVVKFSLLTGEQEEEYPFPGAVFLNDIDVSEDGMIFITDFSLNKIHFIKDGSSGLWFEDEKLKGTNGLLCEPDRLLVGTDDGIFAIDYNTKELVHLVKDTGGIDGLRSDGYGNYIISDWAGKVQIVGIEKEHRTLFDFTEKGVNAADIEYIINLKLLLVPTFFDNRVVAYDLIRN